MYGGTNGATHKKQKHDTLVTFLAPLHYYKYSKILVVENDQQFHNFFLSSVRVLLLRNTVDTSICAKVIYLFLSIFMMIMR